MSTLTARGARFGRLQPAHVVLAAGVTAVAWLVVVPLAALVYVAFTEDTIYGPGAFTLDNLVAAYGDRGILRLLGNSLAYAIGASLGSFVLGAAVAWLVERTDVPFRGFFHTLAITVFAVPGLLVAMAWTLVLSPNIGWVNALVQSAFGLAQPPFNIYSLGGMIWILASHNFPFAYMLMGPAFRLLDARLEEAAVMAGASGLRVAARVTLPLLRPAMLATIMLLFIRGLESFEVPRIVGVPAGIPLFATAIQEATGEVPPRFGVAGALSLMLLALCFGSVALYRAATANADAYATVTGKGYAATRVRLGRWRGAAAAGLAIVFVLTLGLPLFTLVWQSFFHNATAPSLARLTAASLDDYRYLFRYPVFAEAALDSFVLAAAAATLVVALTFMMAWLAQRAAPHAAWLIDALAFAPVAIPSVIVGAAILFAYLILPIPVYNTLWILLIAYVTLYLPFGMRFAAGGLAQIHRELEECAEMCGAGLFQLFRRVLAPLLLPMLSAAWLYVFVLAVRELAASIFLAGPRTHVLATVGLTLWEGGGSLGAVCALGVIQIVPLIPIVIILRRLERRAAP